MEKWNPLHFLWESKLVQPLWKTVWRFLIKLKIELPYDSAIPLLDRYLEKTHIQKDTCTPMFTATLFTIVKTWTQPRRPSTEEGIRKMWYTRTMEYHSAMKRKETGSFVEMWMNLQTSIERSKSEREKQILYNVTYMWNVK